MLYPMKVRLCLKRYLSNGIEPGTAGPAGQRLNRRAVGLLTARAVSRKSYSLLWTWFRWEIVSKAPDWSVGSEEISGPQHTYGAGFESERIHYCWWLFPFGVAVFSQSFPLPYTAENYYWLSSTTEQSALIMIRYDRF